jgi:hypothetical protein
VLDMNRASASTRHVNRTIMPPFSTTMSRA